MKSAQNINTLINENIFQLKVSSLRQDVWYLEEHIYVKAHILYTNSFNKLIEK